MRHVRMLGLCLVAALALGAYATSSAMAGPQWVQCKSASELEALGFPFEAKQVKYVDANCTEKNPKEARAYVLLKAPEVENLRLNYLHTETANVRFSGGSVGGGGVLTTDGRECQEQVPGKVVKVSVKRTRQQCAEEGHAEAIYEETIAIECANETNTGETEGKNKVANVHVVFTGCLVFGSTPCQSEGAEEGEVITSTLKGKLGYLDKAAKEVGVVLEPEQKHGAFAEFECGGYIEITVGVGNKKQGAEYVLGEQYPEGCYGICPGATPAEEKHGGYDEIISPITPVNTMTDEFTQVFAQEAEYPFRNIPTHLENKHLSALENYIAVPNLAEAYGMAEDTSDWSVAGEVITNVNISEEEGEIKA